MNELLSCFNKKSKNQNKSLKLKRQDAILSRNHAVKKYSVTRENINTIVFACPGSGVKRSYLYPNMLQPNSSFVVMDHQREIYDNMKSFLERNGYRVQILDLEQPSKSDDYNPLSYCKTAYDVNNLVDCFLLPTKDLLVSEALKLISCACISFLTLNAPGKSVPYCCLLEIVGERFYIPNPTLDDFFDMLEMAFSRNGKNYWSLVDMFKRVENYEQAYASERSYCLFNWINYYNCVDVIKDASCYSSSSLLDAFRKIKFDKTTSGNKISIESFGIEKTAVFINIPYVAQEQLYLVRMFLHQVYSVLFKFSDELIGSKKIVLPNGELVRWISLKEVSLWNDKRVYADILKDYLPQNVFCKVESYLNDVGVRENSLIYNVYSSSENRIASFPSFLSSQKYIRAIKNAEIKDCVGCCLPVPVRVFIKDIEMIGEIPCFTDYMAIARGVNISTTIITQSVDEIEKVYGDHAEVILENCAYWLYMGASSPDRCEFLENRIRALYRKDVCVQMGSDCEYSKDRLWMMPIHKMVGLACQKGEFWIDDKFILEEHPNYKYLND